MGKALKLGWKVRKRHHFQNSNTTTSSIFDVVLVDQLKLVNSERRSVTGNNDVDFAQYTIPVLFLELGIGRVTAPNVLVLDIVAADEKVSRDSDYAFVGLANDESEIDIGVAGCSHYLDAVCDLERLVVFKVVEPENAARMHDVLEKSLIKMPVWLVPKVCL